MKYIGRSPGEDLVDAELPQPSTAVERMSAMLEPGSSILDFGAGNGRNGLYLAQLGHRIHSVEIDKSQISKGSRIAGLIGKSALGNRFIEADIRTHEPGERYDAVIASFCLQYLTKAEAVKVINKMQRLVKPGGLNVVDAYIASADQQYQKPDYTLYEKGELIQIYETAGWNTSFYETTGIKPQSILWDDIKRINKSWIVSQEGVIFQEVTRQRAQREMEARALHFQSSNPEYSDELFQQADSL